VAASKQKHGFSLHWAFLGILIEGKESAVLSLKIVFLKMINRR
jgi:hypothetical protein